MKKIIINKKELVKLPKPDNGIVAFQLIEFVVNFYGKVMIMTHDTKIMENGKQFVIDGCGFIPQGFEIEN
jgi:hypothetical protein